MSYFELFVDVIDLEYDDIITAFSGIFASNFGPVR